ncbi:MAG: hypothetical protein AAGF11_55095 [Myxococcota bacterium]
MNHDARDLFSRAGHLTALTLDRYDAGELDRTQREHVERHLGECLVCRRQLNAIREHAVRIAPPSLARPSTGSVTVWGLAASGGMGLAAAAVLALASALWPGPQRAQPQPRDPAVPQASAYTSSSAQEYDVQQAMGVQLDVRGRWLEARAEGEGYLAIVIVSEPEDDLLEDTDGGDAMAEQFEELEVRDVLQVPVFVEPEQRLRVRPPTGSHRLIGLVCAQPFEIEAGEPVMVGADCQRYELQARFGQESRDS